jgi:plasmid stabilization system protein ParE
MSGFVLHPQAYADLDEIWEYIAADNLDAADRVREEIYAAIQSIVPFPYLGHSRPHFEAVAIPDCARVCDRLRAGGETSSRNRRAAWTSQSTCNRSHSPQQRLRYLPKSKSRAADKSVRFRIPKKGKRPRSFLNAAFINAGNDLLFHTLSRAVQSAQRGF